MKIWNYLASIANSIWLAHRRLKKLCIMWMENNINIMGMENNNFCVSVLSLLLSPTCDGRESRSWSLIFRAPFLKIQSRLQPKHWLVIELTKRRRGSRTGQWSLCSTLRQCQPLEFVLHRRLNETNQLERRYPGEHRGAHHFNELQTFSKYYLRVLNLVQASLVGD